MSRAAFDGGKTAAGWMLQSSSKFPVWIIEHVWAHKMMDVKDVIDPSSWPDVDSQPLSLEDSWRLRVVSAQVYSIIKNRDVRNFERVVGFLETTHRLLPRLVPAIKHMKVVFGLKTMVIMWMLKDDKGVIDIVSKVGQFFPNKLPQYQDQCSQRTMFLMRKNHLDFKSLAQTLAINKDRLEDYIKNQMEEQYGERYAQKVEDRVLLYLQELEASLSGETYIDKILKKQSPVTAEEKLLLEVITSDSKTIASVLKNLLHCDVSACWPDSGPQPPAGEVSQLSHTSLHRSLMKSGEGETSSEIQPDVLGKGGEAGHDPSESPLLFVDDSDAGEHRPPEEQDERIKMKDKERNDDKDGSCHRKSRECGREATSCPQFCSKHQRWVKNILQGCSDECSEELLLHQTMSSSPVLFQSSSSTSSSRDLTPSDLVPSPADQPPSQTSVQLQAPEAAKTSSGSLMERLPKPTSSQNSPPPRMSPVVQLLDIASLWRSRLSSRSQQEGFHHVIKFTSKQSSSRSSSLVFAHCCTSGRKDSMFVLPEPRRAARVNQDFPARSSRRLPAQRSFSTLSTKFSLTSTTNRPSLALKRSSAEQIVENPGALSNRLIKESKPFNESVSENRSSQEADGQNSTKPDLTSHTESLRSKPPSSLAANLSAPYVRLTRLSLQECLRAAEGRRQEALEQGSGDDERATEMEEDTDSSFDVNTLFSSDSSSSGDSFSYDPDYKPCTKKKKTSLGYEST
uniref:TERF1-interacting nuclear factor 2 N-terminal domain-containing protein n=1 Tax=Nothobranchius kuhntae TaxID=321403 RepID=A0A1A8JDI7_NOTKU